MSEAAKKANQKNPESYKPQTPEILALAKEASQIEKTVEIIIYKGVEFEVVERSDVLWVGCVDYANNNTDESDIGATLKRFQGLVELMPIQEKINPDYSAALSINYGSSEKPCGIMFANESYSDKQDERYDLFTQPGGLWLRVAATEDAANALNAFLGRENHGLWEYFGILRTAAKENGYKQSSDIHVEIEYNCHAGTGPSYAYIPIINNDH